MISVVDFYPCNVLMDKIVPKNEPYPPFLKFSMKNERRILKTFLLGHLYQLFCELFQNKLPYEKNDSLMECYVMDSKIIQLLLNGIVETEEYTLEGIAYYTHIPFDVIYDAACGINNHFSIALWARVIDLYLQVKPDVTEILMNKLLEITDKNRASLYSLLIE